ncbi:protein TolR [Candidatus Sororendozoicomonas aggregata]|uniref:protein TolR n=1 Tax=Candidatus Sororendozoicomonas aggregata TaxID=3073239 RepID=UPI002ED05497
MSRARTRRRPMADINMVPFIDIMMVLLVAFMVSAPMLTQGIKVELPEVVSKPIPVPENQESLIVSVKADGQYFLDLGDQQDKATSLKSIQEKVSKVLAAKPATNVLIKGDKKVDYGAVVILMARLRSAGVNNVGLITDAASLNEK